MSSQRKSIRGKFADEQYLGPEPDLRGNVTNSQIISAYGWYNYFYDSDQAKQWVLEYIKEFHSTDKELLDGINGVSADVLRTCGWNCRILLMGGNLPSDIVRRNEEKLRKFAGENSKSSDPTAKQPKEEAATGNDNGDQKVVVSVQDRIANRANELISEIETEVDTYVREGKTSFRIADFLMNNDVKAQVSEKIKDYYLPLYNELYDVVNNRDQQLVEAYKNWKKSKIKAYMEFVKDIITSTESRIESTKAIRKPRKKKVKPAAVLVAKLKYKEKDDEYSLQSVKPSDIIGSNQLWAFNTKYRTLSVYNARGPAGLSIKGCTVIGFDEKTSITKTLRKPKEQLKEVLEGGKVALRKFMDGVKCKPKEATGRINSDVILLRVCR